MIILELKLKIIKKEEIHMNHQLYTQSFLNRIMLSIVCMSIDASRYKKNRI